MASGRVGDNNFGVADFIVDGGGLSRGATHTTIAAALADASSGDSIFIRPGTYTENITLPAGLYLWATSGGNLMAQTILNGTLTQTATGTSIVSNLRFTTNGAELVNIGGTGVIQTTFNNCSFFMSDGDCLVLDNSNASPSFEMCNFHQTANTLDVYNITSCTETKFNNCRGFNSGVTPGVSTIAAGQVTHRNCTWDGHQFTTSSAANFQARYTSFFTFSNNLTALTTAGTGANHELEMCYFRTGTATAISVGAGTTMLIDNTTINSTNATLITETGTVTYNATPFTKSGTFTPGVDGSTGSPTVAYTSQLGQYTRIGKLVFIKATIVINTFSGGTGDLRLTGLPFAVNTANGSSVGTISYSGPDLAAGTIDFTSRADQSGQTYIRAFQNIDNGARSAIAVTALAAGDTIDFTLSYWTDA